MQQRSTSLTGTQLDWVELNGGLPLLTVGNWIRTSYHTGPYQITEIMGPCSCTEYVASLDGDTSLSESHFHLTCKQPDGTKAWLNGYRSDGTSVWNSDRIFLTEHQA